MRETTELRTDSRGYWSVVTTVGEKRTTKTFGHSSRVSRQQAEIALGRWKSGGDERSRLSGPTVGEVLQAFLNDARKRYCPGEMDNLCYAIAPFNEAFGDIIANDIRPSHIRDHRQALAETLARTTVNARLARIRRAFRWAVENELMSAEAAAAAATVRGARHGEADEPEPIDPIDDATVDTTLAHACPTITAMARLQRLTGMRPGEVCAIAPRDIDRTRTPWVAILTKHKTARFGVARRIYFGPAARAIVEPYLRTLSLVAPIFSPRAAVAERRGVTSARYGTRYTTRSYRRAIWYACDAAFPPPADLGEKEARAWRLAHRWSPNRLRHTALTAIERANGLDAARAVAGHRKVTTTQMYVERDDAIARSVIERVG
jgi:integrase